MHLLALLFAALTCVLGAQGQKLTVDRTPARMSIDARNAEEARIIRSVLEAAGIPRNTRKQLKMLKYMEIPKANGGGVSFDFLIPNEVISSQVATKLGERGITSYMVLA